MTHYFRAACGIQIDDEYVVTGGYDDTSEGKALKRVISYNKTGYSKTLADLSVARFSHACGKFVNNERVNVSIKLTNPSTNPSAAGFPCNWRCIHVRRFLQIS